MSGTEHLLDNPSSGLSCIGQNLGFVFAFGTQITPICVRSVRSKEKINMFF